MKIKQTRILFSTIVVLLASTANGWAQQHPDCPMMQRGEKTHATSNPPPHAGHTEEMNARGDQAMGFDQAKTTHHFRLFANGGAIDVEANEVKDEASRDQIRRHLANIAAAFAAGDFAIPMMVHDQVPPGVDTMKQLRHAISYSFEETEKGGRVRIRTSNSEALAAVHQFLRFQIKEHSTGDSVEVLK